MSELPDEVRAALAKAFSDAEATIGEPLSPWTPDGFAVIAVNALRGVLRDEATIARAARVIEREIGHDPDQGICGRASNAVRAVLSAVLGSEERP